MKYYYYSNDKNKKVRSGRSGLVKEHFVVYCIDENPEWPGDVGERKCRTVAKQLDDSLAGGYFTEKAKPYNLEDYIIINVPGSTRTSKKTKKDKFIEDLIEAESNTDFVIV